MSSILDRYGIKEVADVVFYRIENGKPAEPVLYLDTLKVSTIEQTAENTSARGGKGNPELITWDYNREINVTLEDALFSPKSLSIMFGDGSVDEIQTEMIDEVDKEEYELALANGESVDRFFKSDCDYLMRTEIFTAKDGRKEVVPSEHTEEMDGYVKLEVYSKDFVTDNNPEGDLSKFDGFSIDSIDIDPTRVSFSGKFYINTIFYTWEYNRDYIDGIWIITTAEIRDRADEDYSKSITKFDYYYDYSSKPTACGWSNTFTQNNLKFPKINPKFYTIDGVLLDLENGDSFVGNQKYYCTYDICIKGRRINVSSNSFPGVYYITGNTYARSEANGIDEEFQFIIPKAKILSENTISMEAEGDPSVFNMNLKVLKASGQPMMQLVQYSAVEKLFIEKAPIEGNGGILGKGKIEEGKTYYIEGSLIDSFAENNHTLTIEKEMVASTYFKPENYQGFPYGLETGDLFLEPNEDDYIYNSGENIVFNGPHYYASGSYVTIKEL